MQQIALSRQAYLDKVKACWTGKNIGGTLGGPHEGKKHVLDLTFYDPVPDEAQANDDLDLQLVWLVMLEEKGVPPKLPYFAEYWDRYLFAYPWDEYGFCSRNLDRGLRPPVSGWFENYYTDNMGSPIRSEIWACIAPADPQRAASMAWMDASMDHAGGEGVYGEMFWAAVESAAFVLQDPMELIRIGLAMIPGSCSIAKAIREAVRCHTAGLSWATARECVASTFPHPHPCHAPINHGFTIIGWLYGADFGDRLCKAVNCGHDTDCTGATLGSLLGILDGMGGIPDSWRKPVGEKIILHKFTQCPGAPGSIDELTSRTATVAEAMLKAVDSNVSLGDDTALPHGVPLMLRRHELARTALRQDIHAAQAMCGDLLVTLHYDGDPVALPGRPMRLQVSVGGDDGPVVADVGLKVADGWHVSEDAPDSDMDAAFIVTAVNPSGRNVLAVTLSVDGKVVEQAFVVLGPDEARGYPALRNVQKCPTCNGRAERCLCA